MEMTEEYEFKDFDAEDLRGILGERALFEGATYQVVEGSIQELTGTYLLGGDRDLVCGDYVGNKLADQLDPNLETRILGVVTDFPMSRDLAQYEPQFFGDKPIIYFPKKYGNS